MSFRGKKLLLVGDNPFHGISHLSEDRARARGNEITKSDNAARLVLASLENGADGFMFSVSETTLSILRGLRGRIGPRSFPLYAIVPYAYEYVRLATHLGTGGLARRLARQIVSSNNLGAIGAGLKCIATMNPSDLLKAYLLYEISRIRSSFNREFSLKSVMLHEVVTEMIISLNLEWLAKSFIEYAQHLGIEPGFETRNFAYLAKKFENWDIDFKGVTIATAFNRVGFQMNPSKEECEEALARIPESNVIAMSILASGYLKLPDAAEYAASLSNLKGVVVGVSNDKHAAETFQFLGEKLSNRKY